jgi:hypothetical protein
MARARDSSLDIDTHRIQPQDRKIGSAVDRISPAGESSSSRVFRFLFDSVAADKRRRPSRSQRLQVIGPRLHHFATLCEILRVMMRISRKTQRFSYFDGSPRTAADERLEAKVGIEPAYTALQAAA